MTPTTLRIEGELEVDPNERGDRTWSLFAQDLLGHTGLIVEVAEPVEPHTGVSVLRDETD